MSLALTAKITLRQDTIALLESSPKKLFIAGEWGEAADKALFPVLNPATGEQLAQVALAGIQDVDQAVAAARAAFESGPWRTMTPEQRGNLLWALAELIDHNADQLAELETLDNGKPLRVSRKGDLPAVWRHFRYYAGWATKLEGTTIPLTTADQAHGCGQPWLPMPDGRKQPRDQPRRLQGAPDI